VHEAELELIEWQQKCRYQEQRHQEYVAQSLMSKGDASTVVREFEKRAADVMREHSPTATKRKEEVCDDIKGMI